MKTVWLVNYCENHEGDHLCGVYSTKEKAVAALREIRRNLMAEGDADFGRLETDRIDGSVGFGVTGGGYLAEEHIVDEVVDEEEF